MTPLPLRGAALGALGLVAIVLVACTRPTVGSSPTESPGTTSPAAANPTLTTAQSPGRSEFEGARAYEHIRALTVGIGPRVAGTEGERKGAEYVANAFRASGYSVEVTEFGFSHELTTASIDLGGTRTDATVLSGSGFATVSGPAVYAGTGSDSAIAGKKLTGAVAVVERGLVFGDTHDRLKAAGAVAMVILNPGGGPMEGNLGKKVEMPVVLVDTAAAEPVRAAARAGSRVTVTAEQTNSIRSVNVLARPAAGQACSVLVGGHLDTVPGAPGALDNGSGTATVLELARAFAADGLDAGLCFAAFGGEEEGLYGSGAMVSALRAANALPKAMINLDMTGLGTIDVVGSADLAQQAESTGKEIGIPATRTTWPSNFGSDHQSFQRAGVPAITVTTSELGEFHTPGDVLATIDAKALEDCGDLAYALIARTWKRVAQGQTGS
ncbi:MAG: M28 family metallopeptidase [Dehalococcoidia bacterium]